MRHTLFAVPMAMLLIVCSRTTRAADPGLANVIRQPSDITVSIGGTATFPPFVNSNSEPAYQWLANGSPIAGETNLNLTISDCQRADSGWYVLRTNNDAGQVASKPAYLTVNGSPAGTLQFRNTGVPEAMVYASNGGTASGVIVELFAGPAPDRMRSTGASVNVTFGFFIGGTVSLPFVEPFHPVYVQARVSDGQRSNVFPLNSGRGEVGGMLDGMQFPSVNWPSPVILEQPQDLDVSEGASLILSVLIRGHTNVRVKWLKNGAPVPVHESTLALSGQTSVEGTATFEIPNVALADAGNYKAVLEVGDQFHFVVSAEANVRIVIPPAGQIDSIQRNADQIQITGSGRPNRVYTLESRTPLSGWTPRSSESNPTGNLEFAPVTEPADSAWFRLRSSD